MNRKLAASILTLGVATTALAGPASALAASQPHTTVKQTDRTQAGLMASIKGFGYALVTPNSNPNRYATPSLLAKAPAQQIINLLGPAQNPPATFTFRLTGYTGSTGTAMMELARSGFARMEGTSWVYTPAGWKLSAVQYIGTKAPRQSLLAANAAFMRALQQGGQNLNSFATPAFLRQVPGRHIINLYGFQNPFRRSSASVNWFTGSTAQLTQRFDFGGQTIEVRTVTWLSTDAGWRIIGIGVAGTGRG